MTRAPSPHSGNRSGSQSTPDHSPPPEGEKTTIDAAFQHSVGEFGRGQQLFYCLAQLAWFPAAMQTLVMVFVGLDPVTQQWFACANGPEFDSCTVLLKNTGERVWGEFCRLPADSYTWTRSHDSIVSEWDLVCSQEWKQDMVNSAFFGGFWLGAGLLGACSDRIGRKGALLISLLTAGFSGILCGLAPSYGVYCFARFMTGVGVAGTGLVAYVLGCEYVGPSWRGFLGVSNHYFFVAGLVTISLLAYYFPNWRGLCFITGASALLYTPVLLLLPESPRWQLIAGHPDKAMATLELMARRNGTEPPSVPLKDTSDSSLPREGLRDVVLHQVLLLRLLVQLFAWFAISAMYYGITLMAADLPGSVYTNNTVMASVEVVSVFGASLLMDRLGRRWTVAGSYLLGGVCLVIGAGLSGSARLVFTFIAKLGAAAAFPAIFIYAAELFPTVVRNSCMGVSSQAARIGGTVTPFIILIGHKMGFPMFGFLVLGVTNGAAGLLLLTQPETLNTTLSETIQDVPRGGYTHTPRMSDLEEDAVEPPSCDTKWTAVVQNAVIRARSRFTRLEEEEDSRDLL